MVEYRQALKHSLVQPITPEFLVPEVVDEWEQQNHSPLTPEEVHLRAILEAQVTEGLRLSMQGFYLVGNALKTLKSQKLHRDLHLRFDEYAKERFKLGKRYQHYLMNAVEVMDALAADETYQAKIKGLLPLRELHCRELLKLGNNPNIWKKAWHQSILAAGEQIPTGRTVRDVVNQIKVETREENPFEIGDICLIAAGDNLQLRGLHGCWAIVVATKRHSCDVKTGLGLKRKISSHFLHPSNYTDEQQQQILKICTLLEQIPLDLQKEEAVTALLKILGKRSLLSDVEADLLTTLLSQK